MPSWGIPRYPWIGSRRRSETATSGTHGSAATRCWPGSGTFPGSGRSSIPSNSAASFNVPPFGLINNEHFLPAVEEGIKREQAEVDAIVANPAPAVLREHHRRAGTARFLSEVTAVFGSLQGANTNKELQALARKTAPMLAAHGDNIGLDPKLFARVKAVYDGRVRRPKAGPRPAVPPGKHLPRFRPRRRPARRGQEGQAPGAGQGALAPLREVRRERPGRDERL